MHGHHDHQHPIIYLIRHGEKPPKLPDGKDQDGLSAQGIDRAEALVNVFGKTSPYNIGSILAEHPKSDGGRDRPSKTVLPLSQALGLEVDTSIGRDDVKDAAKAAKSYGGPGNVLICWEHGELVKIAKALGATKYADGSPWAGLPITYPSDRFDLIWTVLPPYEEIASVTSEQVSGLDGPPFADPVPGGQLPAAGENVEDGPDGPVTTA